MRKRGEEKEGERGERKEWREGKEEERKGEDASKRERLNFLLIINDSWLSVAVK